MAPAFSHRRRIAVVAPNWLGDAAMSMPVLGMLAASGVEVTVVTRPYPARVFAGLDGVASVAVTPVSGRWKQLRYSLELLTATRPQAAIVLPPSFSSAMAPILSGVRTRVGVAGELRTLLLTSSVSATRDVHCSDTYRQLGRLALGALEVAVPEVYEAAKVRVFESEREELAARLSKIVGNGVYVVVAPGAVYGPTKKWPLARFRELVARLANELEVVLSGGPGERDICDTAANGLAGVHNLAGELSMGAFFALLESAATVVANDSGTAHLAAALGAPVVVLYGSTSPTWTAPLGTYVDVVRHPVHCSPCFRRTCPTELECFNGITVDDVYARTVRSANGDKNGSRDPDRTARIRK